MSTGNDQCSSCQANATQYTPEAYGNYLRAAVQRIQQNIPNVIVNLSKSYFLGLTKNRILHTSKLTITIVGDFRVSPVYTVTANQSYCQPFTGTTIEINSIECGCAKTAAGKAIMDQAADGNNTKHTVRM